MVHRGWDDPPDWTETAHSSCSYLVDGLCSELDARQTSQRICPYLLPDGTLSVLHHDPVIAARMASDRHSIKMILESAQMLCTVAHDFGVPAPYKLLLEITLAHDG